MTPEAMTFEAVTPDSSIPNSTTPSSATPSSATPDAVPLGSTTTAPVITGLRVRAIPWQALRTLRDVGTDIAGNPLRPFTDVDGGTQLRCCLRYSRPGERISLISYAPVSACGPAAPYAEVGPVFVHADDDCSGYPEDGGLPREWQHRERIFRAYHRDGSIAGGRLVTPDDDHEAVAREILADPDVEFVHVRNVVHGCYMFEIRRA